MDDFLGPRDPKMMTYPLMNNSMPTVVLSSLYLLFVLYLGPHWMSRRKPFLLRSPMFIYNMVLVALSSWIVINCCFHGWSVFNFRCEPIDFSYSDTAKKMTQICWVFYISKLVEYCDTIFFVLRKKTSQINFLHVFHHCTVPITAWYGVTYGPGGYNMIFPTANSFVHVWMYLYYGLSALGPGVQRYLWWKKYITTLQMIQFVFVSAYFLQLYMLPKEDCKVSSFLVWLSLGQAIIYLILFYNFYNKSYKGTKKGCRKSSLEEHNGNAYDERKKFE